MRGKLRIVWRVAAGLAALGFAVLAYGYLTLPDVRPLATTNPTTTAFWELRAEEAVRAGKTPRFVHRWVPYARISQNLKRAVLVAEDSAFWDHDGVDYKQMREAIRTASMRGTPIRGASTITQQLAKNLYLSPSRNPLRKLSELIIARRLEAALTKQRIFEIYLNVIEWGDGVWGAEAAARTYFKTSAASLSPAQAALLAGAIINPRVLTVNRPTRRLLRRQQIILGRMRRPAEALAETRVDDEEDETAAASPAPALEPGAAPGDAAEPSAAGPSEASPEPAPAPEGGAPPAADPPAAPPADAAPGGTSSTDL